MKPLPITCVVLTKNSATTLEKTLESLARFDEVIVCDTGSTDGTLDIANRYRNVKVIEGSLNEGFGKVRIFASQKAKWEWILSIDSDEALSQGLIDEIETLELDPSRVYSIPFRNWYRGQPIKGCGWSPDRHVRLYHKISTNFSESAVHEAIQTENLTITPLSHPIDHESYRSLSDFLVKMERYSNLFATQNRGKKSSLKKALCHGIFAFFKSYILKRGLFDGRAGLIISLYNGHTAYYKYAKLAEINAHHPSLS